MKKLLLILILFPTLIFARLNPGLNKFNLPFNNCNTGYFSLPSVPVSLQHSTIVVTAQQSGNKIDVDFKTGADNLEMKPFQDGVEIRIIIQNRPDIILLNANKNQSWPSNSIKRVSLPLPDDITVNEIKEIHIYRKQKLGGTPITTIFNIAEKDNWNVNKISTTARIKVDGVFKTFKFADFISPLGSSNDLFRFIYEGGNGRTEGQMFKGNLSYRFPDVFSRFPTNTTANPVFRIETLTGGDDLRGGNDNLNVLIRLKIRPVRNIAVNNINNRESWGNFTERNVTRTITAPPFTFNDIEDIVLRHTGGGGMGADNWYLDKLKITLTIAGETKVLIDQVGAPIHYFTGDSRSKIFTIN